MKILLKKGKNLLKISAIYLGTVIGAGFASGQELLQFFVRFSWRGMVGCIVAGFMFCALGAFILSKSYDLPRKTYRNYLKTVFPTPVASFLAVTTELFLCVSFCVMLSGAGAFFRQRLSLAPAVGIFVTAGICLLVFCRDLQGLSLLNLILTPVMIFGSLYVSVYAVMNGSQPAWLPQINNHGKFLPYALFYVGYNMLTAAAVLVPVSAVCDNKRQAVWGGALGGALLTLMMALCTAALFVTQTMISGPLPLLFLAEESGVFAYILYSVVLYMAMLTTAVSTGFSVVERIKSLGINQKMAAVCVCTLAIPFSFIEFSLLVRYCYLFFGFLGILLVFGILWDWYKRT